MIPILEYGISCPPDWIYVPVKPDDDVESWVKEVGEGLIERGRAAGYEIDPEPLQADLRARAEDSRRRSPLYAFLLYPDGFDNALSTLEVDLIHPDESVPQITLDWLAETFSVHDFGPPEISRTDLPLGSAVRIRQNFAADADSPEHPGILLETLTYGSLPEGTESAVILLMSWTVPGIADAMEEAADSIARTLTVEATAP
ncbi:hypothetical protein [Streptomyces yerevanensis]|uniref:hypothetical protein n=1 Tax=Streptomyces yerevanensis TaxID=66378 RepID=UPI000523FC61|nr:hypothetical protein [Streptomyces yerevanensis]